MTPQQPIHRSRLHYAGIADAYRLGAFGVEENATRLRRYEYILRKLVYLQSGHLPKRARWELKAALGKHLYEDSEAVTALRARILDLRQNERKLQQEPDQRLTLLMDELLHARTDGELLVALYEILRPALRDALVEHLQRTQHIVDQPTVRILRSIVNDLDEQLAWGREAIAELVDGPGKREEVAEFQEKIAWFLAGAGRVTGDAATAQPVAQRRWRSLASFTLPERAVRDRRFPGTIHYHFGAPDHQTDESRTVLLHDRVNHIDLMRIRQEEMCIAEILGAVIWARQDQPWEFTADIARHLWDEMRHSLMGQAACENEGIDIFNYPQKTADYDLNITNLPAAQYIWLHGVERQLMRKTGKRAEYEYCRDVIKHPLMTQFQDYDWADEVKHAHIGQEWGPDLYDGDQAAAQAAADRALTEFQEAYQRAEQERPQPLQTADE